MLTQLHIQNFRGINSLSLNGFARFNIFVGRNGCGKTTLLEAVSVVANQLTPGWLNQLGVWRELPPASLNNYDSILSVFPQLDSSIPIVLKYKIKDISDDLHLTINSKIENISIDTSEHTTDLSSRDLSLRMSGVSYDLKNAHKSLAHSELLFVPTGYQEKTSGDQKKRHLGCFYIHARRATSLGETARALTELYAKKQQALFIEAMKRVDSRIQNLVPGTRRNTATVLADIGLATLIPINLLGDGFCRICLMATGAVNVGSKLLIVDEIDSGLHHTVMADFWRSLDNLSRSFGTQVFCSTHNDEMLRSTIDAFQGNPDDVRIIRIDRNVDEMVTCQFYTYDLYQKADNVGLDVR